MRICRILLFESIFIGRCANPVTHEATEHDAWFRREVQIGLDAAMQESSK